MRTASSEQVRQPLYTRALGTWRRYEKHLGPWQEELADIIAELPESVRNAGPLVKGQTSRPWMALRTSIVRFTDSTRSFLARS